jgi:hypothetical protein
MFALALADTAKIEPQHYRAGIAQCPGSPIDHFVMHSSAKQRMGMAEQCRHPGGAVARFFQ